MLKAMLVASEVLPIEGRPARISEIGGVQAAEALVEVGEAGGEAGEAAVALVGGVGDADGVDDGAAEGLEAAVDLALLAELVERLLGLDDLVLGSLSTSMRAAFCAMSWPIRISSRRIARS